jgi:2-hydroxychromene-2-carboxylate isomerase
VTRGSDSTGEADGTGADGTTTVDGMTAVDGITAVDVHIDLMCPWAYQSSQWMRSVRDAAGIDVRWRWFSLEEVNRAEGKKHPWERPWAWGWSLLRIGAHLRRVADDPRSAEDAVDRWCAAAGRALHVEGRKVHTPEVARAVLAEAGLDAAVADDAVADATTHDDVRADHQRVTDLGGFGVPTLVFPGDRAIFGPIIREAPADAAASLRLWHLVTGWLEFPALYEVRRPKTADDWAQIGDRFAPYLSARDWPTIQREVL